MEQWTPIIIALIAALPPSLLAFAAMRKANEATQAIETVHVSINSRMDQLLEATASASRAEGVDAERTRSQSDFGC